MATLLALLGIPQWLVGAVALIAVLALLGIAGFMLCQVRQAWSFVASPAGLLSVLALCLLGTHWVAYRRGLAEGGQAVARSVAAERARIETVHARILAGIETEQKTLTESTAHAMQEARQRQEDDSRAAAPPDIAPPANPAPCGLSQPFARRLRARIAR